MKPIQTVAISDCAIADRQPHRGRRVLQGVGEGGGALRRSPVSLSTCTGPTVIIRIGPTPAERRSHRQAPGSESPTTSSRVQPSLRLTPFRCCRSSVFLKRQLSVPV